MADNTSSPPPPPPTECTTLCLVDLEKNEFTKPVKEIYKPEDMDKWRNSKGYHDLMGFILTMNESVKSKKVTDSYPISEPVKNLIELMNTLDRWIDETPPTDQPQRFGNKAFRTWFSTLQEKAEEELKNCVDEKFHIAIPELSIYLIESVGNSTRIDYGTGHEMSFAAFLCCLFKIGALTEEDGPAVVFKINESYLRVVRKLQLTYRMEPAGSHGVWSLDDHQFIPFIWGSAQLIGHPRILPKSFVKEEIYEHFSQDYIFLACIKFINQVKTGPFHEHSNQLWNIAGVPNWNKVNSGLIKMYRAEVLDKFPVIQHFLFGSLMSIESIKS